VDLPQAASPSVVERGAAHLVEHRADHRRDADELRRPRDLLVGLAVGADDYVTKPFSPRELVARIRVLLRRVERRPAPPGDAIRVGELELDPAARRVCLAGETVHLTPTEFDLLAVLCARPGVVFSREQLLAEVWGWRDGSGQRTVDSHVRGLRRKLGGDLVRTVHGLGYALEAPR
jgi:DNA-binding response OmpR family regulator